MAPDAADPDPVAGAADHARGVVQVAAVDLGASSGRVMLARVGPGTLELTEVGRFANEPVEVDGTLHWDVLALWRGIVEGLGAAVGDAGRLDAVGIDSWAVDFGLLDADGRLLGNPVHYRDARTDGQVEAVRELVPPDELYATTGLQVLPINTIYQLASLRGSVQLDVADRLLLVPDLVAAWLTGRHVAEVTNASTTQLFDATARTWADDVIAALGLDRSLFADLVEPGETIGEVTAGMRERIGVAAADPPVPVVAVGSHDTASAVVAVPMDDPDTAAWISCGTWSLVGMELPAPVLTEASRAANFTNELGVDGTVRYLRNVMGLWLLSESQRTWRATGEQHDLGALLDAAAEVEPRRSLVDPDHDAFLAPGDMPERIRAACRASGQPVPDTPARVTRCIVDSLAVAYRRTIDEAADLAGRGVAVVHVVGGGSRNALLCQLTADATGLPVLAGPVEATAIGNALVQARALGALSGGLADLRDLVRATVDPVRHDPTGDAADWDRAVARVAALGDDGEA